MARMVVGVVWRGPMIYGAQWLEVHGWAGVMLRADAADVQNHELGAASNVDVHTRLATAVVRQGKTRAFTSGPTSAWATTDSGDAGEWLTGVVQRLTRDRSGNETGPLGLNRWEDRVIAGQTVLPDDGGAKATQGWEVDSHGAQPQTLPDHAVRRLTHRGTTRYQAAGQRIYRAQKHIQDYRKLDCSTALLTQFVNFKPLLDNIEWTFIAERGQMIKDDGTVTRRWGIAPPEVPDDVGRWDCDPAVQYAITNIRYTVEAVPKVAHESNPTNCLVSSAVGTIPIAIGHVGGIKHPLDPQVNGMGFYRPPTGGGTQLLIQRVPIPMFPSLSVTYGWEAVPYMGTTSPPLTGATWVTATFDNRQITTGEELRFEHAIRVHTLFQTIAPTDKDADDERYTLWVPPLAMGTQQWEPGSVITTSGTTNEAFEIPTTLPHNRETFIQNSEDVPQDGSVIDYAVHGRHGTHRWEVDEGFVTQKQTFHWAYGDVSADGALGAAVETDHDLPPDCHYTAEHMGFVFLFGTAANENFLYWSKRWQPESFPAANFLEVGSPSDKSRGLASLAGLLGFFTETTKYRLTGSDSSSFVYQEALSSRGCPAPLTIVPCERGILFTAFDGVWQTTLTSPDQELSAGILPLFMGQEVNGMKPIDWTYAARMSAEYHKNRYYVSYVSKGATDIDTVAVYSFDTQQWTFYAVDARSLHWEDERDIFLYGATDGQVYALENGALTDDGLPIAYSLRTKEFGVRAANGAAGNFIKCLWLAFKLDMELTEGSVTVRFYADGVLRHTATVTGNRTTALLRLPEGAWGTRCRIEVSGDASTVHAVHGVSVGYLPLEGGV